MPRVYISSTFLDLEPYRKAAADAARAFECETIAMEDYVAMDERPLDKCLADVRRSDIYIGIIAKRYGYRPPGQTKSITRLEYEAAGQKTRLMFFLHDREPWDAAVTDTGDDAKALADFKKEVEEARLAKRFTSPDNLEAKVSQALGMYLKARREVIPPLLPYLADRSDQADGLRKALDTWRGEAPGRPVLAIIHGSETESHSMFVDRLQKTILPGLLERRPEDPEPKRFVVHWSDATGPVGKRLEQLHTNTMEAVVGRRDSVDVGELAGALSRLHRPTMVTTSILSADWQKSEEELIRAWAEWWGRWPDMPSRQLLTVLLTVRYRELPRGLLTRITHRRDYRRRAMAQEAVKRLDLSRVPGIVGVTLDRLEGVKESHIRTWFDTHVKELSRDFPNTVPNATKLEELMMSRVGECFQNREYVDEEGRISMETMAKELRRMLEESLVKEAR